MRRLPPAASLALLAGLAALPARAATLAQAVQHWTGLQADVIGAGQRVTIDLPPPSPIPSVTAEAHPAQHGNEPGWQLNHIALRQPVRLSGVGVLTARAQTGEGWLGARTASAQSDLSGITLADRGGAAHLDHAALSFDGAGGPVALSVTLDGLHLDRADPAVAILLPQHAALQGHTTEEGAAALSAMAAGHPSAGAPVTIDAASLAIGPAEFNATGTVRILTPRDREGTLTVTATRFKDLLKQIPLDGAAAKSYPVLMILRQLGHKEGGEMRWTVAFSGEHVLVEGIDIAPLLAL